MILGESRQARRADRHFIERAMRVPILTREEELALVHRWHRDGDEVALHRLINAHVRLVVGQAVKFRHHGLPMGDGYAEVLKINKHATQEQFSCRHRWRKRDLVVWDNRCTLHCATDFDLAHERRIVRRTSAKCADPVV